jgi:transcription termination factor Rho
VRKLFVPDSLVAKYGLREGDVVACRMVKGEDGYIAQSVQTINEVDARSYQRKVFEECDACYPKERIHFYHRKIATSLTAKYLEWLIPVGKGQRGCILSEPKAGKTSLLSAISKAVNELNGDITQLVLLTAQPPEALSIFRNSVKAENLVYTSYEDSPHKQIFAAEFLLKRAKRYAEGGQDVVLIVDSLNALARAYEEADLSEDNRMITTGLSNKALQYVKNYFASARCFVAAGSLTIIGAISTETGNPADTYLANVLGEMSNLTYRLSERLAIKRIYHTIDFLASRTQRGDGLITNDEREMESIISSEYLPKYGEEGLRQALANSQDYESFKSGILSSLKQ